MFRAFGFWGLGLLGFRVFWGSGLLGFRVLGFRVSAWGGLIQLRVQRASARVLCELLVNQGLQE